MLLACYRFNLFRPAQKKFRKNAPLRTGTPRLMVDCSMYHPQPQLLRPRQFEVDGVCASPGAFEMKTFFKVVVWIAAVFLSLFVWNVLPDFRPLVSSILAAAFVCYVLSIIVEVTVKRVMSDEQIELRSRLDLLDRKVTAILRDSLEQRRLR